jgi:hypothetical protein
MTEKMTGYLLLFVGLAIMVICVVSMFLVFTNRVKPFSVFNISSNSSNGSLNISDIISELQKNSPNALNQAISLPKLDILSPEVLNQTLNLSSHFFLMSFILGFGYKLATLGIQLIRTINVKLKSHLLEVINNGDQAKSEQSELQSISSQPVQPGEPVQPIQPMQI